MESQKLTNFIRLNLKWILGILLVLMVGIVLVFFYNKKKNFAPAPPAQEKQTLSGLDIAKHTALFLGEAQLSSGDFKQLYICNEKSQKDCQAQTQSSSATLSSTSQSQYDGFIAQALGMLYEKTSDVQYKDDGQKTLSFILTNCHKNKTYCANGLPGLYEWYKLTLDPQYKDAISQATDNLLANRSINQDIESQRSEFYSMVFEVTGDQRIKSRIENVAQDIMADKVNKNILGTKNIHNDRYSIFYKEGDFEVRGYQILASNWLIEAYRVTKNPLYLDAAQKFFDSAKIYLHMDDFKKMDDIGLSMNGLEYLLNIADVSEGAKKQAYLDQAHAFAQAVVLDLWDNPQNPKFNGDYGFVANFNNTNNINFKITALNGLRLSQFLRMSDQIFYIK